MALIEYDLLGKKWDKVEMACKLLKSLEPKEGYIDAFSGGKDSQCAYHLCELAGVKFEPTYSVTSVDPPELVRFIKDCYPDAWENRHHQYMDDGKTPYTMWNLIPQRLIPPTRIVRYCCDVLKESSGKGRVTVTGVRWAESANRQANQGKVTILQASKKEKQRMEDIGSNFIQTVRGGVVLNNDNAETREVVEMCYRKRKTLVNPIVDWSDEDVWEFLNDVVKVPHCELYDCGHKRLGCIGCPMNRASVERDFANYPKYRRMYIRTFEKLINARKHAGLPISNWENGEDVMAWWLGKKTNKQIDGQIALEIEEMMEEDEA